MLYAIWFGGGSYAIGDDDDIESFPSLAAAKRALQSRYDNGYTFRQDFEFVNRPPERNFCPCVDESSEFWIFNTDPTGVGDKYPDCIINFGPRGGIVVEST